MVGDVQSTVACEQWMHSSREDGNGEEGEEAGRCNWALGPTKKRINEEIHPPHPFTDPNPLPPLKIYIYI